MNTIVFDGSMIPAIPRARRVGRFALVLACAALCGPSSGWAGALLGAAETFAVLGGTSVTNTGATTLKGDLGVGSGASITGSGTIAFSSPGTLHDSPPNDAASQQARAASLIAYSVLKALPCEFDKTGTNLGGLTLTPGVYCFSTAAGLSGTLTLNAMGDPNALFVFQIAGDLTTESSTSPGTPEAVVEVVDGDSTTGVFWQVGSTATLGDETVFAGNILALASVVLDPGAKILCGRALAQTAGVTMNANAVSNDCSGGGDLGSGRADLGSLGFSGGFESFVDAHAPGGIAFRSILAGPGASAVPEPSTLALIGFGLAGVAGLAVRRRLPAFRRIIAGA